MVECDFPKERPVARKPSPSVRTLMTEDTSMEAVRNRAMGVRVRSLNCLPQVFTQILLDRGVILKCDSAVSDDLLTLTIQAMYKLESNRSFNYSDHSLEDQCRHFLPAFAPCLNFLRFREYLCSLQQLITKCGLNLNQLLNLLVAEAVLLAHSV